MKCKHNISILKCEACVLGVLIDCEKTTQKCKELTKKKNCFVSAFIEPGTCTSATGATGATGTVGFGYDILATKLISTFTLEQLTAGSPTNILCKPLPITGTFLQLGACRSSGWGLAVERDPIVGPYAFVQTPKCCSGCYSFELSASVTLTGTVGTLTISLDPLGLPVINVIDGIETSLALTFDLSLCEVKQDVQCTGKTISVSRRSLTHIPDAPCASTTFSPPSTFGLSLLTLEIPLISNIPIPLPILIPALVTGIHPINLSTSGIICLKDHTKLVPCITIRGVQATQLISLLGISVSLISGPFNLRVTCLSLKLKKIKHEQCVDICCDSACSTSTCR